MKAQKNNRVPPLLCEQASFLQTPRGVLMWCLPKAAPLGFENGHFRIINPKTRDKSANLFFP